MKMEINLQKTLFLERFNQVNDIELIKMLNQFLDYALAQQNKTAFNSESIPEFHKAILKERLYDLKENPDDEISWKKVQQQINAEL